MGDARGEAVTLLPAPGSRPRDHTAIDGRSRGCWTATSPDGRKHAAVSGTIRWEDKRLQELADNRSPAEALLAAWDAPGERVTESLAGSFSVAFVDEDTRTAVLAIDRFGIEQMYWCTEAGRFHFASSGKELLNGLAQTPGISHQSVFEFLYFHMVPSPATIWDGVFKLKPGTQMVVSRGEVRETAYWQPQIDRAKRADFRDLRRDLFAALRDAVAWAAGDTAPGAFLSGGLDSSTVCGLLQELSGAPVRAYSVGFSENAYDELDYARIAAERFQLEHHCIVATAEQTVDTLAEVLGAFDEPFGNSSVIPSYFCARAAATNGTRVLLAGDGGDELFAGNVRYARQKLFEQYSRLPGPLRRHLVQPLLLTALADVNISPIRKVRRYVEQAVVPLPDRLQSYNHLERWPLTEIFTPEFIDSIDPGRPSTALEERFTEVSGGDYLDRLLYLDWQFTLADNDLRKVTRTCELAGVEVRFPFLDERVVDLSLRVPSEMKLRRLQLRHFYKNAMRGFLPNEIIRKSKHGFGLPFGEWLKTSNRLQELIYSMLGGLVERRIVRAEFIDSLIAQHRSGHAGYYGTAVWVFMALEAWLANNAPGKSESDLPARGAR